MKSFQTLWLWIAVVGLAVLIPGSALAEPSKEADPCASINDNDERNLCRAFEIEKQLTDEQRKNRFLHKNHSSYYCSLITSRDKQTYCYAVVNKEESQCGLIVDADLEKQCNSKF